MQRHDRARAASVDGLAEPATALAAALQALGAATQAAWATGVPEEALANATPYLQAFGHVVLAWMWLDVALAACRAAAADARRCAPGQARRDALLLRLRTAEDRRLAGCRGRAREPLCREMRDEWF